MQGSLSTAVEIAKFYRLAWAVWSFLYFTFVLLHSIAVIKITDYGMLGTKWDCKFEIWSQ